METLNTIKKRVKEMPSVSGNTLKILNLISEEDYSIKDLAGLIQLDISLSTRCLKIVNSASFGLRSTVTSIERAVSYLGKQAIFALVIESGFDYVFSQPLEGYHAQEGELWDHSLRTAFTSRNIAIESKNSDMADLAYTAGLLHNIGKVILAEFLTDHSDDIKAKFIDAKSHDFNKLEKEYLEINHTDVGGLMADNWNLPDCLKYVIQYHHEPSKAPEEHRKLCYLVHLGDHLAMIMGKTEAFDSLSYKADPKAKKFFNFQDEQMEAIVFDTELEMIHANEKIFSSEG